MRGRTGRVNDDEERSVVWRFSGGWIRYCGLPLLLPYPKLNMTDGFKFKLSAWRVASAGTTMKRARKSSGAWMSALDQ
jgi:hypothetical protein